MTQLGWILDIFEDYSHLAKNQRQKPKKSNSLKNFASLDAQLDPQVARLVEIYQVLHFVLKFDNSSALYNFFCDHETNAWSIFIMSDGNMQFIRTYYWSK